MGLRRSTGQHSARMTWKRKRQKETHEGKKNDLIGNERREAEASYSTRKDEVRANYTRGIEALFVFTDFFSSCHIKKNFIILEYQIKSVYKYFLTPEC